MSCPGSYRLAALRRAANTSLSAASSTSSRERSCCASSHTDMAGGWLSVSITNHAGCSCRTRLVCVITAGGAGHAYVFHVVAYRITHYIATHNEPTTNPHMQDATSSKPDCQIRVHHVHTSITQSIMPPFNQRTNHPTNQSPSKQPGNPTNNHTSNNALTHSRNHVSNQPTTRASKQPINTHVIVYACAFLRVFSCTLIPVSDPRLPWRQMMKLFQVKC